MSKPPRCLIIVIETAVTEHLACARHGANIFTFIMSLTLFHDPRNGHLSPCFTHEEMEAQGLSNSLKVIQNVTELAFNPRCV